MTLSFIVAVATNRVIGRNNKLPWKLSTDLKRFKALTTGHTVIMGRKTFDEIGRKPLPNRLNVVVSRSPGEPAENVIWASTIEDAIAQIPPSDAQPFIIGGADIFRQTLPIAQRMYVTQVHAEVEGDTYMPEFDDVNEWKLIDREDFEADEKNDYPFSFLTYERATRAGAETVPGDEEW